ncbi:ABC transporter ATP-binding protein [Pseudothermotoga sp. U03pept]|uniref:ABC transporter ATP-binding protein n=1 Tax=Pseudothermotoga sp. U03pept TaxID=3447012 RepID=UPI003F09258B
MAFVEMVKIFKVYPPDVVALSGVDLSLERGEIHSVVGENGAGKSTLMRILYGMVKPSAGFIFIDGKRVSINSPSKAMELGIGMVHQEFMLVPSFTVYENVILGQERTVAGFISKAEVKVQVQKIIDAYGFDIDSNAQVSQLSVAAQQKVEIIKQLYRRIELLILDEPTAVLTPQESDELFERILELKRRGKTIVFISHKLDEVLKISDRITVLRKGEKIATVENKSITASELAKMMVGKSVAFQIDKKPYNPKEEVLLIRDLHLRSEKTGKALLDGVEISARAGEIVGIAGVEGNGQYELVQTIIGTIKPDKGKILVNNIDVTAMSIRDRRKLICYVPQDRKYVALALKASILENLIMTHHLKKDFQKGLFSINWKKARQSASEMTKRFEIVHRNLEEQPQVLSGGNQQKVVVAREFSLDHNLILLDQPTRGLDIASTEYIHKLIIQMRDSLKAVLLISADLDELMQLSDRLYVMRNGRIVAHLVPTEVDLHTVGKYMLGAVD